MPQYTKPILVLLKTRNTNLADNWMKHHPASHHKSFQPLILTSASDLEYLELTTPKAANTKSFVNKLLMTPTFQKMATNKTTFAAQSP
jgi:hypothetical protein